MFARVKQSRNGEYLQVVESYREGAKVRQRVVLYVGHYGSVEDALERMPKDLRYLRGRATRAEKPPSRQGADALRRGADALAERLGVLRGLVGDHPDLVERDRGRARRHAARRREAFAERRAAREASR